MGDLGPSEGPPGGLAASLAEGLPESLRHRLADFFLIADLTGTELLVSDALKGNFIACNRLAQERLGYSADQLFGLSPESIQADPDHDAAWVAARRAEVIATGSSRFRTRHRRRDDSIVDVVVSNGILVMDGRQLIVSCVQDETLQRHRETELLDLLRLLEEGSSISGIGVWDLRFSDGRMRWSEQMRHLCHQPAGEASQTLNGYGLLVHPDDRLRWSMDLRRAVARGDRLCSRHRLGFADGSERMVEVLGYGSYDQSGAPIRMVGTLRDVTQSPSLVEAMAGERMLDSLTSLPNKIATLEELGRRLNGRRYNASLAVLSLDVDGFEEINDTFGSDVGDRVLRSMATRLRELAGQQPWLARLSSDQFLIILEEGIRSIGDAMAAARRLQQDWNQQPPLLEDLPLTPTFSVGLACYPEHAQDSRPLIQCANTALMRARAMGRNQLCAYSSTISRRIQERMAMGSRLSQAIDREELRLQVQPQRAADQALVGGEILLRWTNHLKVSVPPSQFLPLAEESGLMLQLWPWILRQSLQQVGAWQAAGLRPPRLALNVSPTELERPQRRFVSTLAEALREHGLQPEQLELEIAETALIHNPLLASEHLRLLADQGFRIAIDNFGTGYSSLELLRSLPVHRLKIDRTFVRDLAASAVDRTIVATTITLAHGLGMQCTAEGVETEEQWGLLRDLGCDCFQGDLCGQPLEPEAFEALLREQGTRGSEPPHQPGSAPALAAAAPGPPGERSGTPSPLEQLRLLRAAVDSGSDSFLLLQSVHGPNGCIEDFLILDANPAACTFLAQDRDSLIGEMLRASAPQMGHSGWLDLYADAAMRTTPTVVHGVAFQPEDQPSGTYHAIEITPDRGTLAVRWRDVTEQVSAARGLADAATLYRLLADNIVDVMLLLDRQQGVVWVSPSLQPMTGWLQKQWLGRRFGDLFVTGDDPPEPVDLSRWLADSGPIRQGRLRLADPEGGWSWVQLSVRKLSDEGLLDLDTSGLDTGDEVGPVGNTLRLAHGYVITLQPVDQQVMEERLLLQRANTDPLTGLCSRGAILDRLGQRLLDQRVLTAQPLALLFCDCDGFKGINDRYGHACGDAVLRTVAERITSRIRHGDLAGRIGGDEFLVLLDGIRSLDDGIAIAEALQASIGEPFEWNGATIVPSCSIGVALHGAGEDADLFLKRADRNMYTAKAAGRHRVVAL
jgi:diguanylate cyclase (GGDEF)-like protein/PAS domain S-box-containing protein